MELIGVGAIKVEAFQSARGVDISGESSSWTRVRLVTGSITKMCAATGCSDVSRSAHNASVVDVALAAALDAEWVVGLARCEATRMSSQSR